MPQFAFTGLSRRLTDAGVQALRPNLINTAQHEKLVPSVLTLATGTYRCFLVAMADTTVYRATTTAPVNIAVVK